MPADSRKEDRERLRQAAAALAENIEASRCEAFIDRFVRVWMDVEDTMNDRIDQLDIDGAPHVEALLPHQPAAAANLLAVYTSKARNIVTATVNNLIGIQPVAMRIETLDAIVETLQEARKALAISDSDEVS